MLPWGRRPLQPETGSTPESNPTESEADRTAEEQEEEQEEELGSRKDSLERLICSEEEEEESEEILLEDDQVDDFASSVLAAISCWHLSVPMVTEAEEGSVSADDKPGGTEPTHEQDDKDQLAQEEAPESEPAENPEPEPEPSSDPGSLPASPPRTSASSDDVTLEGDPEPTQEPSSATPDSEAKTLSSAESSEDEEDMKNEAEKEGEATSILPSSVLDKASAIAQHFTSSIKRGSLEDHRSPSCASPRPPSRTGSSLSLSAEPADRHLRLNSACSDPAETFGTTDLTLLSPRDDSLFDSERGIRRRRDSTLSKQDQLLIGKIKSYYENAENQDAAFSLQRRESLTYIPTGLVRSSVSRLNSIPKDKTIRTDSSSSATSATFDPSSGESNSALPTDTQHHMVSSDSLDSFDQSNTDPEDSGEGQRFPSHSRQDNPPEDEEFRPSSEMIKIWQTMEREITRSQSEDKERERYQGAKSRVTDFSLSDTTKAPNKSCNRDSGASDLSTITEEASSPSPLKASSVKQTGSLTDPLKVSRDEAVRVRVRVPRVAQLKAEADGERPRGDLNLLDDVDKTKSKVLHLARQYSQRIKTTTPVIRQRSHGVLVGKQQSLASVTEEKESAGKANLTLPLVPQNQAASLPLSPVDPIGPTASVGPARSRSPLSPPRSSFIEGFAWPDVRELRSKYSEQGRSQRSPVSWSRSLPEQMFDAGLRRHSSCSSSLRLPDEAPAEVPLYKPHGSREERRKRLHRANSLDARLSRTELQTLQDQVANGNHDGYYVAAEAPLSNDPEHKIIVMEKLSEAKSQHAETESREEEEEEEEDNYIQIRSPTSREKISIMAVIDRCRVYQDSDQYKQREEVKANTEPVTELQPAAAPSSGQDEPQKTNYRQKTDVSQQSQQSLVRNLREKFQNLN